MRRAGYGTGHSDLLISPYRPIRENLCLFLIRVHPRSFAAQFSVTLEAQRNLPTNQQLPPTTHLLPPTPHVPIKHGNFRSTAPANAANSQHSTGPKTEQGKARSAQNATRHGLTSRDVIIAPGEGEEFEQLLADFNTEIKPRGAVQQALFDDLVAAAWNLRRARRLEAELCDGMEYRGLLASDDLQIKLDRIARHKTRIERTFHRCLKELKIQQTNLFIQLTLPRPIRQASLPLASANEIAKRTQYLDQHDRAGARALLQLLTTKPRNIAEELRGHAGLASTALQT